MWKRSFKCGSGVLNVEAEVSAIVVLQSGHLSLDAGGICVRCAIQ